MIDVALAEIHSRKEAVDLLVLPFFQGEKKAENAFSSSLLSPCIKAAIDAGDFKGKDQEMLFLYPPEELDKRVLLLGFGPKKEVSRESLRLAGASLAKAAWQKKVAVLHLALPEKSKEGKEAASAIFEGILLGSYRFDSLKGESRSKEKPVPLKKIYLAGASKSFLQEAKRLSAIIDAVNFTRDLVNGNADDVNSESMPKAAKSLTQKHASIKVHVLGKKQIEKEKLGLILAVNRAAARDPALIVLEYKGKPSSSDVTGLVGKGVTFDTGGLNLKPAGGSMETMKDDMSGAGAVLGVFKAAAALRLKVNLVGVLPIVENAIGPLSYKPGDVYPSHSGKTIEISNTDAEGRLVLADALSYMQAHYSPSRIIDLATLTGGIIVALGEEAAGLYCNDEGLAKALAAAGDRTADRVWRMPLFKAYTEMLKSKIADMKNSAGRKAGPGTGAAFVQEFILKKGGKPIPWAHLDIASTAFLEEPRGLHATSATGAGVRILIDFLEHLHRG